MSLIMVIVFAFLLAISYPVAHSLVVGSTLGILSGERIPMFAVIQQRLEVQHQLVFGRCRRRGLGFARCSRRLVEYQVEVG